MSKRGVERFAPLTGVVFVVLIVVAILIGGETPDNDESQQAIVQFWSEDDAAQIWSSIIGAWGTVFFMWFAASVRSVLKTAEAGPARLSSLSLAGAAIATAGLLSLLTINFQTADTAGDVPGEVTHTLTILSNGFFLPMVGGFALFFLAIGVVVVRTGVLPAWLGWIAVVLGVLLLTPVGFFALLAGLLLVVALSVILFLRAPAEAAVA